MYGDNVAAGYWRKPPEDQQCFGATLSQPSSGIPAGPWLRTGDLGFVSGGQLFIVGRIKDLRSPFQWGWYVVPAMNGRTSIKVVLPALVPSLGYADLEIQEGGTASGLFQQVVEGRYAGDQARLRHDLLAYCGRDTYAMVKVLEVLEGVMG